MDHHLSHPDWTAAVGTAHLCVVQGEFTEQCNNRGIQGWRENFKALKYWVFLGFIRTADVKKYE